MGHGSTILTRRKSKRKVSVRSSMIPMSCAQVLVPTSTVVFDCPPTAERSRER